MANLTEVDKIFRPGSPSPEAKPPALLVARTAAMVGSGIHGGRGFVESGRFDNRLAWTRASHGCVPSNFLERTQAMPHFPNAQMQDRMNGLRGNCDERVQNEGSFVHPWMRHGQARLFNDAVPIEQKVNV